MTLMTEPSALRHRRPWTSLLALLALAGCAGTAGTVVDTLEVGPLRLQQVEMQSGLQVTVNASSGVIYYSLRLTHRGEPVLLPDANDGSPGQTRDARQGWLLPGAPRPAALMATDRWLLVTDDDGKPQVQELATDGIGWRWLEPTDPATASTPMPGMLRSQPQPLAMTGGRRLLLGDTVVFDITTLKDRKSTRLNSSHNPASRMPSSA
jgi:hypothetical protein